MHRAFFGWAVVISVGVAALDGCAVGTDPNGTIGGESNLTNVPIEAGDENTVKLPPPSADRDSGAVDSGGTDPDAGTKSDAAPDSGSDSGTGGAGCASPNVCTGATDLGTVSGDKNADTKTAQGSGSQWFTVRVTENDNTIFGAPEQVRADLQSPTGTHFDLFVYVAGGAAGQECSAVTTSSTSAGGFNTAATSWGESASGFSNGSDDSRTVTVEVRHVSGTCAPAAKWTLTFRGNTP